MAKQHLHEIGKVMLLLFVSAWMSLFAASGLYWILEKAGHPAILVRAAEEPSLPQTLLGAGIYLVIFGGLWRFAIKPLGAWYYSRRKPSVDYLPVLSPMKLPDEKRPEK